MNENVVYSVSLRKTESLA